MPDLVFLLQALGPDAQLVAVGGSVRDRLLGRSGGDLDLATALMPEIVMKRARESGLTVIPTGLAHGTVTIVLDRKNIEVTTYRGEGDYLDGRRPSSVLLGVPLITDLARRDFTINAMAVPIEYFDTNNWRDHIVDPFYGQRDLGARLIRTVGDPVRRFSEDGLRPYRACRFVSQLGFTIETTTANAITQTLNVASSVAVERVYTELTKLLTGIDTTSALTAVVNYGLLDLCMPELIPSIRCTQNDYHAYDVWNHTLETVRFAPNDVPLRWAALLHDVGKPSAKFTDATGRIRFHGHETISVDIASRILIRLKASNALHSEILALIKHHGVKPDKTWSDATYRRFLHRLTNDGLAWQKWAQLQLADQSGKGKNVENIHQNHATLLERMERIVSEAPPLSTKALAIDGKALMALTKKPQGPWIGALQKRLLEAVMDNPKLNTLENLKTLAKNMSEIIE